MCKYTISCPNPASQFILIQLEVKAHSSQTIELQLPAWRAGRYQLANYAQYVRSFQIKNQNQENIQFQKLSKDCWAFQSEKNHTYLVEYEFFCARMDAGGAWVDEEQVYLNFINSCFEVKSHAQNLIELELNLPSFQKIVCTIPKNKEGKRIAENFQMLVDSTLLASNNVQHWTYVSTGSLFHIWIQGTIHFDIKAFLDNFQKFTDTQIKDFGEFPESQYHFIFQLLPYKHYHGVEHQKGTVITLGPAKDLVENLKMEDLLGVSSHELYHAWNVCRIRPKELLPYDFSKETYTQAGWLLEGITTYMGDLYLLKSGVYSLEVFLKQIESTLQREVNNLGWKNQNILESSFDLWLDGYQPGIPDRKVNIYTHGSLICFCLDLLLIEGGSSFPQVMKLAWQQFGKPRKGYSQPEFWNLILSQTSKPEVFKTFYERYISGNEDLLSYFSEKITCLGIEYVQRPNPDHLAGKLGVLTNDHKIVKVHPESPAFDKLMIGDQISFEESVSHLEVKVERTNGNQYEFTFESTERYFPQINLAIAEETDIRKKWMN